MKLLITGGAGFIGSHFIRHMLAKYPDYQIINLGSNHPVKLNYVISLMENALGKRARIKYLPR